MMPGQEPLEHSEEYWLKNTNLCMTTLNAAIQSK